MDTLELFSGGAVEVLEVFMGAPGPAGPSGGSYVHVQTSAVTTWTITHGLSYQPNVAVLDADNNLIDAAIEWPDENTVIVTLAATTAGMALLS